MKVKRTPLCEEHIRLGGKMVEFAGWFMPVEYSGLRPEHMNVRNNVGLFDVSHMGEIRVRGPKSLATLEWVTTNHVGRLQAGQAQYSLFPNEQGGVVDDLIVYCLEPGQDYLLCVNAANTDKDWEFIQRHNKGADLVNESESWGQIAVQGPKACKLLSRVFSPAVGDIKSFHFLAANFKGSTCLIARTGYTGEDGFEVFVPAERTVALWSALLEQGRDLGVLPSGLGARDTLRTEMKYSLYGHEIDDTTNPYEAELGWVVKPDKKDFLGRAAILERKENGLSQRLVGFVMQDKAIARQGYRVLSFDNAEIGRVTSGTPSPSLGENIGIAYVPPAFAEVGSEFLIEVRNRKLKAKVVQTPFVKPKERESWP